MMCVLAFQGWQISGKPSNLFVVTSESPHLLPSMGPWHLCQDWERPRPGLRQKRRPAVAILTNIWNDRRCASCGHPDQYLKWQKMCQLRPSWPIPEMTEDVSPLAIQTNLWRCVTVTITTALLRDNDDQWRGIRLLAYACSQDGRPAGSLMSVQDWMLVRPLCDSVLIVDL